MQALHLACGRGGRCSTSPARPQRHSHHGPSWPPGATCPVVSTFSNGVLHLEKNCPTADGRVRRRGRSQVERSKLRVGVVYARKRSPVPGRIAALQRHRRRDDVLPRLQQRNADDQRERHRHLHLHGSHDRGGREPGSSPYRHDLRGERADRRAGACRSQQHHRQRPSPGSHGRRSNGEEPVQEGRVEDVAPARHSRTRASASPRSNHHH